MEIYFDKLKKFMLIFLHKQNFKEVIMEGVLFVMGFAFFAILAIMSSKKNTKQNGNDDFVFSSNDINPANGLPMLDDLIDVGGHVYGTND